jgi:SAM-dependent methyltransferase
VTTAQRLLDRFARGPVRRLGTEAVCIARDGVDRALGRTDPLVPPTRLMFDGPRSPWAFRANGYEFLRHFIELGGLRPEHRVLDVGSGIGRKVLPLTAYLSERGGYEGFDINPVGVRWCQERVTPRYPNFRFQLADVHNRHYNPGGRYRAAEYRFPYDDATFDFVFLGSVFTHMVPDEVANYLGQIARVLRPGGRCLATFFLLDEEARRGLAAGRSAYDFAHGRDGWAVVDPGNPEFAVAYDEARALELIDASGLRLVPPIHHGTWSGRPEGTSFQDLVVAEAPPAPEP